MKAIVPLAAVLSLSISGCNALHEPVDQQSVRTAGASEISGTYKILGTAYSKEDVIATKDPPADLAEIWLGAAADESVTQCNRFMARLLSIQTGVDTSLDLLGMASSGTAALGTIPTAAVSGLAAFATFAAGARATIDADVYGKLAAPAIMAQIEKTYYPQMTTFAQKIHGVTVANFQEQYLTLLTIHHSCGLGDAMSALNSAAAATPHTLIKVAGLADGQTYKLLSGEELTIHKPLPATPTLWTIGPAAGGGTTQSMIDLTLVGYLNGQQAILTGSN